MQFSMFGQESPWGPDSDCIEQLWLDGPVVALIPSLITPAAQNTPGKSKTSPVC